MSVTLSGKCKQAMLDALVELDGTPFVKQGLQTYCRYDTVKVRRTKGRLVVAYLWNGKEVFSRNADREVTIASGGMAPIDVTTF